MQIISKRRLAILIHFIPVQSELSTFKDEAAQPPTPPECLAFLTGRALPWPAKTTQSQRPRSPFQRLNRVGKWINQKVCPALIAMDKRRCIQLPPLATNNPALRKVISPIPSWGRESRKINMETPDSWITTAAVWNVSGLKIQPSKRQKKKKRVQPLKRPRKNWERPLRLTPPRKEKPLTQPKRQRRKQCNHGNPKIHREWDPAEERTAVKAGGVERGQINSVATEHRF